MEKGEKREGRRRKAISAALYYVVASSGVIAPNYALRN
jgi:hypothetical protein